MRILAIDPGENTGFCIRVGKEPLQVWQEVFDPATGGHVKLYRILSELCPDKIIYEPFTFQQNQQDRPKIEYLPAEYVGVIILYGQLNGCMLVPQIASSVVGKTAFWGDSKEGNTRVRYTGLWKRQHYPHGMDALRHMLYYETFTLQMKTWLNMLPKD